MAKKGIKTNLCSVPGCLNHRAKDRSKCNVHFLRDYRSRNQVKYLYWNLKSNAKRRGKEFSLTYEEFEGFCVKTGYDKLKGTTASSMTIDRINPLEGYHKDNIRAITLSENVQLSKTYAQHEGFELDPYCPF